MRLLHTADWHVGKTIRGRPRIEEYAAVLDEVVGIAIAEDIDAVLLAGDVYEQRSPAPEADAVVFETFLRLHAEGIPVVVIPGNHDSAARFEAFAKVLSPIGVSIVAKPRPPDAGGLVEVSARDGSHAARIACVPFVSERWFAKEGELFEASELWYQSYAEGMGELLATMATGFHDEAVNVVLAHLFTDRALLGGGEREVNVGMAYAISPSRFPGTASYVALGHVHRPQPVKGAPAPTRYAGSPLQLDFGEVGDANSVVVVEASPGSPSKVREVPLSSGRRLLDVRGTLDELVTRSDDVGDAYLRVFVGTDGPVPGIAERVREALPNALDVQLVYDRAEEGAGVGAKEGGTPVASMAPREQFLEYYQSQHGAEPDPSVLEAFDEVLELEMESAP